MVNFGGSVIVALLFIYSRSTHLKYVSVCGDTAQYEARQVPLLRGECGHLEVALRDARVVRLVQGQ